MEYKLGTIFWKVVLCLMTPILIFSCQNDDNVEPVEFTESIVIIPDIQYYTNTPERFHYLESIADYTKREMRNISVCLQVGDVTNNNEDWQWENAYQEFFTKLPADLPFVYCLGNHDYGDNGYSGKRESNQPDNMRLTGDFSLSNSKYDNYIKLVNLGSQKYAILSLEFAPRNEVLDWANEMINDYSDTYFVILTHAFLNNQGKLFDSTDSNCDNKYSQKSYKMGGEYLNDSKEIYDKIVFNNTNVKMVICGHCLYKDFIATEFVKNSMGNDVPCIMVNYQHDIDGGSGNIGLLAFKNKKFYLYSYSTKFKMFTRFFTSFAVN